MVPRFHGLALHSKWNGKKIPLGVAITVQETKFTELRQGVENLWKEDGMIPIKRVHKHYKFRWYRGPKHYKSWFVPRA